jgi:YVTN family beta-propeller protein/VCBS repeat-containing protein
VQVTPTLGAPHPTTGVVVGSLNTVSPSFAVTEQPAHGVVSVWPTGGFIYTPDPRARLAAYTSGVDTTDEFTVTATDTAGVETAIAVADVPVHPARAAVVATVPVNGDPEAVTLSPDGSRAYVAHTSEAIVSIIDTGTYTVLETVLIGDHPSDLSFSDDGGQAYVLHGDGVTASVIDTATHSVVGSVAARDVPAAAARDAADTATGIVGAETSVEMTGTPNSIAVTANGRCAYIANPMDATVSVVKIALPPE